MMKRVIVQLTLLRTEDGGRKTPISGDNYGCPIFFEGVPELSKHGYDCRMSIADLGLPIRPGDSVSELGLRFLSEEDVLPYIKPGVSFTAWERGTIGHGKILRIEDA